jgi:hypothetical protein
VRLELIGNNSVKATPRPNTAKSTTSKSGFFFTLPSQNFPAATSRDRRQTTGFVIAQNYNSALW